ncbi:FimV/HubP family polar landmark protein [Shewanella gaetbuli]|uniref:LysM domain-containing protein n=1 Tax=Shewanella gaetbuli TaxID=220752 RepID=A0A9X2CG65_9GAMM|nr:FimV/HubP family polar landmark protein [Shewanella gaetbuli]MCL1142083.1 hypothetical protein [Shewanella gaetbuli]
MSKMLLLAKSMILIMVLFSDSLSAAVAHVSINSRQFEINQTPKLKLNFVAHEKTLTHFRFMIAEPETAQTQILTEQVINSYLVGLSGNVQVNHPDASLVIMQLIDDQWQVISQLALFDAPLSEKSAALSREASSHASLNKSANRTKKTRQAEKGNDSPQWRNSAYNAKTDCRLERSETDTLWKIASRYYSQWNTNIYGAMLAIFETNSTAFKDHKIHLISKNAPLMCPSANKLAEYHDKAADKQLFEILEEKHRAR